MSYCSAVYRALTINPDTGLRRRWTAPAIPSANERSCVDPAVNGGKTEILGGPVSAGSRSNTVSTTAAATTTNPSPAINRAGFLRLAIFKAVGVANATLSVCPNSSAVANRSTGSLAKDLVTTSSTPTGTVLRNTLTLGTGSAIFLARIACGVDPVYGGSPPNNSNNTQPSE